MSTRSAKRFLSTRQRLFTAACVSNAMLSQGIHARCGAAPAGPTVAVLEQATLELPPLRGLSRSPSGPIRVGRRRRARQRRRPTRSLACGASGSRSSGGRPATSSIDRELVAGPTRAEWAVTRPRPLHEHRGRADHARFPFEQVPQGRCPQPRTRRAATVNVTTAATAVPAMAIPAVMRRQASRASSAAISACRSARVTSSRPALPRGRLGDINHGHGDCLARAGTRPRGRPRAVSLPRRRDRRVPFEHVPAARRCRRRTPRCGSPGVRPRTRW